MVERYYFTHDATQHGPYSALEMRHFADAGEILPSDTVWKEGALQRIEASRIKNLYSLAAPPLVPALAASLPVTAVAGEAAPAVATVAAAHDPAPEGTLGADPQGQKVAAATPAPAARAKPVEAHSRPKRVNTIRGGILCGQDGVSVRFKKKCEKCGHEDPTRSSAVIRTGSMNIRYFCPTCRKSRTVQMTGIG